MNKKFLSAILLVVLLLGGCVPSADIQRTRLCFTTQHHEKIIPNITIYVKLNTEEFPGYEPLDQFDLELVSDENGRVCWNDFPLGHHWFLGTGYDEEIRELVLGNIDLRFDLRNLQVDTILYVGEE